MMAAAKCDVPVRISHTRTTDSRHKGITTELMLSIGRHLILKHSTVRLAIFYHDRDFRTNAGINAGRYKTPPIVIGGNV